PEQRMSWMAAARALGQDAAERAVSVARDGALWVQRAAYERAARWAPPHMGEDLRRATTERDDRAREATRLRAQAAAEQDARQREALQAKAQGADALSAAAAQRREQLQRVQDQREAWHTATEDLRRQAMLADAELHRRHDHLQLPPLHQVDPQGRGDQDGTDRGRDEEPEPVDPRDQVIDGQTELFGLGEAGPQPRAGLTERPESEAEVAPELEERAADRHVQTELDLGLAEEEPTREGDTRMRRALEQAAAAKSYLAQLAQRGREDLGRDEGQEPTVQERSREERYRDDLSRREEAELERRREAQERQREPEPTARPAPSRSAPAPRPPQRQD